MKRARQKGHLPRKRQRRKSVVDNSSEDITLESFELSDWSQEFEGGRPDSPSMSTPADPGTNVAVDEDYERYVDLVQADCLGFYQISRTVYVVQGWDKQKEATVSGRSLTSVWLVLDCSSCSRIGTTYSVNEWAMNGLWFAFVHLAVGVYTLVLGRLWR